SLNILARILDPSKEMQLKFYDGSVNVSEKAFGGPKTDDISTGLSSTEQAESKTNTRNDILNSVFIANLVEILKSSSPNIQEKAASVLEFVALTDPTLDP
ncbi:Protein ARABIDILLO 1, partial [Sesbania bispinosa]